MTLAARSTTLRGVFSSPLTCGGRLALVAPIQDPQVIRRMLEHLKLPTELPAARPARSPPLPWGRPDGNDASPWPSGAPRHGGRGGSYDPDIDVP